MSLSIQIYIFYDKNDNFWLKMSINFYKRVVHVSGIYPDGVDFQSVTNWKESIAISNELWYIFFE